MTCPLCKGLEQIVYKEQAPSPPYNQGYEIEYAKRCVCVGTKKAYQNRQDEEHDF